MFGNRQDRKKLGQKLIEAGKITPEQLAELLQEQKRSRRYLGELAVKNGHISEAELSGYLPKHVARQRLFALNERDSFDPSQSYLLQTALKFTLFSDDPIRTLMVTSTLPGEGKTVCANYLARTLASVRQGKFLLVDGDLVIEAPPTWVVEGTELEHGTHLPGLLGYEVDGFDEASPANTAIVAHSPVGTRFAASTIYTAPSGAVVFNAGSMQWIWGLDDFNAALSDHPRVSPAVQRMTQNILERFRRGPTSMLAQDGPGS